MKKSIAKYISVVLHPLSVTLFSAVVITLVSFDTTADIVKNLLILFGIVVVVPFAILVIMKLLGIISDLDISKKEERKKVSIFIIFISIFIIDLFLVKFFLDSKLYFFMYFTLLTAYVIAFFISKKIKVSGHITTLVINIWFLGLYVDYWYLLSLLLVPVLFWSRIHLKRHFLHECHTGFALGTIVTVIFYLINRPGL